MSLASPLTPQDWDIRLFIYTFWIDHARPPTISDTAAGFSIDEDAAELAYRRLNEHHHIFLDADTTHIRMANPLSAVPTAYRVRAKGKFLWANCAWDALGIAAMLDTNVGIEVTDPLSGDTTLLGVIENEMIGNNYVVHFSVPTAHWYDNLIHT
jgi:hypothetical protein